MLPTAHLFDRFSKKVDKHGPNLTDSSCVLPISLCGCVARKGARGHRDGRLSTWVRTPLFLKSWVTWLLTDTQI